MTATHLNVLAERAPGQQRRAPADDGVGSAVHRCGRDVWRWMAPTDQGTSERDDRAHRVGSASGQLDGVNAAEAPSDQAHRAVLVRGGEKFIETVGDVATEPAVRAEAPSVAAVAKAINEPAKWCSRSIVAAQSRQHEHGVAVATARHRQQRTCSHRKRGELRSRSSLPSHHRLPPTTLRHGITIPTRSSSDTSPTNRRPSSAKTRRSRIGTAGLLPADLGQSAAERSVRCSGHGHRSRRAVWRGRHASTSPVSASHAGNRRKSPMQETSAPICRPSCDLPSERCYHRSVSAVVRVLCPLPGREGH